MAALPESVTVSPTVQAIYDAYEAKQDGRMSRRLGASIVGRECERSIWYEFRWAGKEAFDGRMLRLFETGTLAEQRFADNLKAIGCEVHTVDPETNQQFEYTAVGGHFVCKIDGAALGIPEAPKTWHACEFKTHSAKSFAKLEKDGLKKAKPEHYAQLMVGCHLSGMDRGLYLAANKDTDALYAERIRHDKAEAQAIIERAERIIRAATPPARITDDPDYFQCRFCHHRNRCHGLGEGAAVPVLPTCRSCVHATPEIDENGIGRWSCAKHGKNLSEAEQLAGCDDHLFIPDLVTFATCVDAGYDPAGDWTEYASKADGTVWRNSKQPHQYKSVELTVLPAPLVGAGTVDEFKRELGAEAVEVVNS